MKFKEKEYNLAPLTIGDWKRLKGAGIVREELQKTLQDEGVGVLDKQALMIKIVAVAFRKIDDSVTEEALEDMTDMQLDAACRECFEVAPVDRPTSTPSTSSDGRTDGDQASSSD